MGKHESGSGAGRKKPASAKSNRRRKALPLILVALATAIILFVIFILKPPEIGFIGHEDKAKTDKNNKDDPDKPEISVPGQKDDFYTFLLAGTNDSYNTDTIILCSVETSTHKVNMISVPRDSMVNRSTKFKKINNAYGRKGPDELCKEVTEVTGVPIQYYCIINVDSFVKIVDLIGGVDYDVPIKMYHADSDPRYAINLKKGMQTLDGDKAAQFCRFRGTAENDFGRMNRQKDFLMETLRQVRDKFNITQMEGFVDIFNESVKTNMPARDMLWFYMNVLAKMDLNSDIATYTLPYTHAGRYKGEDYVYLDAPKIAELVNKTVNPYTSDIKAEDLNIICLED